MPHCQNERVARLATAEHTSSQPHRHQRTAEEAKGQIHWLRPEYQNPQQQNLAALAGSLQQDTQTSADVSTAPVTVKDAAKGKLTWPKSILEQVAAVKEALQQGDQTATAITTRYKSPKSTLPKVQDALNSLAALGLVNQDGEQYWLVA